LTGEKDPVIEWNVTKSIAGFMNAYGGTLLVGVADDGTVDGIEEDFPFLSKPDRDRWGLWLTNTVSASLGKVAAAELNLQMATIDGRTVAMVDVGPMPRSLS
jgi:predicted HTH transcriptional regulator